MSGFWIACGTALLLCLLVQAFFSGAEIAVVAADKTRLREAAEKGSRGARLLTEMLERPERIFGATAAASTLSVVGAMTAAEAMGAAAWGVWGELAALLALPPFVLILGHVVPRSVFELRADALAPQCAYPLRAFGWALRPPVWLLSQIAAILARAGGEAVDRKALFQVREEMRATLRLQGEEGTEPLEAQRMIHRIVEFRDAVAREVMVPLIRVTAVAESATVGEALDAAVRSGHSRLPVYRGRVDDISGVLVCFDLLGRGRSEPILPHVRRAVYEPETKPLRDLLYAFQRERPGLVVLVDEYGGAVGVASIEDVLEEIVGEIEDEHDPAQPLWTRTPAGAYRMSARTEVDAVNEQLHLDVPVGEYETVGGFLLDRMRRIPRTGETFEHANLRFRVLAASPRAVEQVEIEVLLPFEEEEK